LQRVVRQLRTIARRRDIVAHMGGSLFGILMPQTVMDDALSSRFSRLVALGLMVDPGDPHLNPIGFRIALGTFQTGALDLESFNAALLDKINQPNGWKKRSIRYVTRLPQRTSDMTDMGELWEAALEQAHPGITKRPPKSLP
jgi:GGDEF domain-containing protein